MKVAVAQIDCEVGAIQPNAEKAVDLVGRAAEQGAKVIVLPEIADAGYLLDQVVACATPLHESPYIAALSKVAAESTMSIVSGVAERDGSDVFNTTVVIDASGSVSATYRKTHLVTAEPMCEHLHMGEGQKFMVTDVAGVPSGFMTCYEIRFPEVARSLMLAGAQVIYLVSAFPLVRVNHWRILTKARAIENQLYVVAANRVGNDGPDLTFCGVSCVIDPYGVVLTEGSEIDEQLLTADIDIARVEQVRATMKVLQDRRPELYGDLDGVF